MAEFYHTVRRDFITGFGLVLSRDLAEFYHVVWPSFVTRFGTSVFFSQLPSFNETPRNSPSVGIDSGRPHVNAAVSGFGCSVL